MHKYSVYYMQLAPHKLSADRNKVLRCRCYICFLFLSKFLIAYTSKRRRVCRPCGGARMWLLLCSCVALWGFRLIDWYATCTAQAERWAERGLLAFTRYSFTSGLFWTNQSSFYCPRHLHCPHGCNTIARLLSNLRPPSDPPCVCHTHTILVWKYRVKATTGPAPKRRVARRHWIRPSNTYRRLIYRRHTS